MTVVDDTIPAGSLEALSSAFNAQVATLRQVAGLRCSDMTAHAADLGELEVQAASSCCFNLCRNYELDDWATRTWSRVLPLRMVSAAVHAGDCADAGA